jgi:hypothetical protein
MAFASGSYQPQIGKFDSFVLLMTREELIRLMPQGEQKMVGKKYADINYKMDKEEKSS